MAFRLPGKNRFLQTDNRIRKKSGFNIPTNDKWKCNIGHFEDSFTGAKHNQT